MEASSVKQAKSSPMRMGVVFFLISEVFLFGSLFWEYYYLRALTPGWPPEHPEMPLAAINTGFLLVSSLTIWLGIRAIRKGNEKGLLTGLLATAFLGITFLGITIWEWTHEPFLPSTNAYGSIFFTLTGFHALHVFAGVLLMLALAARTVHHRFSENAFLGVEVGSYYWHFIDLVWVLVFTTLFIIR